MSRVLNLKSKIENSLPVELSDLMQTAGELAHQEGQRLYLVGGVVRDLLLGRSNLDLDLVLEGDAIRLARKLEEMKRGKLATHPHFGTAKLEWNGFSLDLATARSESYPSPGALPETRPGTITDDLARRDFSINAMAVSLSPDSFGDLIDLHNSLYDLKERLIRILHDRSFTDDPTRIWRAIRYEQRLNFNLSPKTSRLLKRDIPMLKTVSGDRIRYELECVFKEERPEKVIRRARELGVLQKLHPSLKTGIWLAEKFAAARRLKQPEPPPFELYLAILAYPLKRNEAEELISYLNLPKEAARVLRDSADLKSKLASLDRAEIKPSQIYDTLHEHSEAAVTANLLMTESPSIQQNIELFLDELRNIRTTLTGENLLELGVPKGPQMKKVMELLLYARLDDRVRSKAAEEELVRGWLLSHQ